MDIELSHASHTADWCGEQSVNKIPLIKLSPWSPYDAKLACQQQQQCGVVIVNEVATVGDFVLHCLNFLFTMQILIGFFVLEIFFLEDLV